MVVLLLALGRHHGDPQSRIPHDGLYPEGDPYLSSDDIFGATKSLVTMSIQHPKLRHQSVGPGRFWSVIDRVSVHQSPEYLSIYLLVRVIQWHERDESQN